MKNKQLIRGLDKAKRWLSQNFIQNPSIPSVIVCGELKVQVQAKAIKHIYLRVDEDKQIRLTCPYTASEQELRRLLKHKKNWIEKQLSKRRIKHKLNNESLEEDALHPFFGDIYRLKFETNSTRNGCTLGPDKTLIIQLKSGSHSASIHQCLKQFYKTQLQLKAQELINHYQEKMQVNVNKVTIRDMKTRWGSCNIVKHRISLNLALAKLDESCLEMVVVHELAHLLEPGHTARFYQTMDVYLPNWREADTKLKTISLR